MSTTEEPEATTDVVDVAADLLPTGTVEQTVAVVDEVPEGGLTTDAAADLLPTGDAPSEPDAPAADEPVVEVLDEDGVDLVGPYPKVEPPAQYTSVAWSAAGQAAELVP